MSSLKPLVLYGDSLYMPGPFKVALVLKELGLQYEAKNVPFTDVKSAEYVAVNPNGRLPALYDPNTDITLWESGAIVQYLVAEYDNKTHKLSFPAGSKDAHLANQFLHFQMSGQGPYYGQATWFMNYHAEKVPSAIERYLKEVRRVTLVLDSCLEGKQYLVGDKCTYADLSFLPWQSGTGHFFPDLDTQKEAPNVAAWMDRMKNRPLVAELMELREKK